MKSHEVIRAGPNADLQVADGVHHICEVQLSAERLLQAKEQGHVVYEQIRVELPRLCPGDWGKMDKIQRLVVSELDAPRPLGGYFGNLRTVRAAGFVRDFGGLAMCDAFLSEIHRNQARTNGTTPRHLLLRR